MRVFPGEAPLLLNFEDPEDMFRKEQWVREEIRRRAEKRRRDPRDSRLKGVKNQKNRFGAELEK